MALVNINGVAVLSGTISMPLVGVWIADLVIDQPDGTGFDAGTSVTITSENGFSLAGVVAPARTGDFLDAVHVRVLGGNGGLANTTNPRAYVAPGALVRDVINGLVSDSGETLSATTDAAFLSTSLNFWTVTQRTVSQQLQTLIDNVAPGAHWRFLPDGTLWIGSETWPAISTVFDSLVMNPVDQSYDLGVEAPFITPGNSIAGVGNIARVEHSIESGKIRTRVYLDIPNQQRGAFAAIQSMIVQAVSGIDYFTLYDAKVITQSADLSTVDIKPVDGRLPGMSRVPMKLGTPGITAQVQPGCLVRLGWNRADPSDPYVGLFDASASVIVLNIKATTVNIEATGAATLKGASATKLGNVGALPVLVQGTTDSLGIPCTQNPSASATTVLAG